MSEKPFQSRARKEAVASHAGKRAAVLLVAGLAWAIGPACDRRAQDPGGAAATNPLSPCGSATEGAGPAGCSLTAPAGWARLAHFAASRSVTTLALESERPPTVDGVVSKAEWDDAFERQVPSASSDNGAEEVSVRVQWTSAKLYLLAILAGPDEDQATGGCVITLAGKEVSPRWRFAISPHGTSAGHQLAYDRCAAIDPGQWSGAVRQDGDRTVVELAVACQVMGLNSFRSGQQFTVYVGGRDHQPETPRPDGPPLYWLLESLRGARIDVVLLGAGGSDSPAIKSPDSAIVGETAYQWYCPRFDARPDEKIEIRVAAVRAVHSTSSAGDVLSAVVHGCEDGAILIDAHSAAVPLVKGEHRRLTTALLTVPAPRKPGVYLVRISRGPGGPGEVLCDLPVLVSDDWAKSVRQALMGQRGQLEATPGERPRETSVVLAHVSRVLSMVGQHQRLTWPVMNALHDLESASALWRGGGTPKLPPGKSHVQYDAGPGGRRTLVVTAPEYYDQRVAWPIYWGVAGLPEMLWLGDIPPEPEVPGLQLAALEGLINVDADHVYLAGSSAMGFLTTDHILREPERWAAGIVLYGAVWSPLWPMARNVPLLCYNNESVTGDVLQLRALEQWLRELQYPVEYQVLRHSGHAPPPPAELPKMSRWLFGHARARTPRQVDVVADGYHHCVAYWASIDAIEETARLARLSAVVEGDLVNVRTDNVLGYTLDLARAPVPGDRTSIPIIENGEARGVARLQGHALVFVRRPDGGEGTGLTKRPGCSGPISDLLTRSCHIIWGHSAADPQLSRASREAATALGHLPWSADPPNVVSDEEAGPELVRRSDLVLIGSPKSNSWISKAAPALPLELGDGGIVAHGRAFEGRRTGVILLYPNPWAKGLYLLLVLGETSEAIERLVQAWGSNAELVAAHDVLVGEPLDAGAFRWHVVERFDWAWRWPPPGPALARWAAPHPDQQWTQFAIRAARETAQADVIICPEVRRLTFEGLSGPLTAGDVYRHFDNPWLVEFTLTADKLTGLLKQRLATDQIDTFFDARMDLREGAARNAPAAEAAAPHEELRLLVPYHNRILRIFRGEPVETLLARWWVDAFLASKSVRLTNLFLADCVVQFLKERPGIDMDAELSRQPDPVQQRRVLLTDTLAQEVISP